MQLEKIKLSDLVLDPANARKHPEKNLEALKGSFKKFGQHKNVVIDKDNVVVAGNGAVMVARELGWKDIYAYRSPLSGADLTAYGLADNRTGDLSEWNEEALGKLLQSLHEDDYPIAEIGFDPGEFDWDAGSGGASGNTDDDEVPEVEENIHGVKRGDIWQLGDHRIMCGDSTSKDDVERLMQGEKADMVLTDPPYNCNFDGKYDEVYTSTKDVTTIDQTKEWDANFVVTDKALPLAIEFSKDIANYIVFTGWYPFWRYVFPFFHDKGADWAAKPFIWCKKFAMSNLRGTSLANATEPAIIAYRKGHKWTAKPGTDNYDWKDFSSNEGGRSYDHPTSKPVALIIHLVTFGEDQDIVYDPFLGSGSTLIACEKTGRKCYGMEIDPHYCSIIIERWQNYTGKTAKLTAGNG